ncbi:MAG: hypothetical protein V3T83_06850, partial [Acidobacteriota bacterium]
FYSQGTREQATSADQFMDRALRFFGDPDPAQGNPYEKGERLARLAAQSRTLLVLDGLEPLQYPPGPLEGRLKDPALEALIKGLSAHNPGLCIITTREKVSVIAHLAKTTAPCIELEHLSAEAGEKLLAKLGVKGTGQELQEASEAFADHALALTLLGTYRAEVHDGDVRHWREVPLLDEGIAQGGHAWRVIESYRKWLGEGPEWSLLQLMGFFDRLAKGEEIQALLTAPAIEGLTEPCLKLGRGGRKRALARLRRLRLLADAQPEDPDGMDAHPLVREYLADHLQQRLPDACKEGHRRLYQYLKETAKELPDTLGEMMPLYQAVAHGCRAGLHHEVFHEVYRARIDRGPEFFSTNKLGAFGAALASVSNFFERPWDRPTGHVTEADQALLLHDAGFHLRALGRLLEAAEPMRAALQEGINQKDWNNSALRAGNLSELHLTLGDLRQTVDFARQSVELADRSGDAFQRMSKRTTLADALHQSGGLPEAGALFRQAEQMQKEWQPEYPLLYSVQGFRYCDLLLGGCEAAAWEPAGPEPESDLGPGEAVARCREVRERAAQMLEWDEEARFSLLTLALHHLTLGRTFLLEAVLGGQPQPLLAPAESHLDRAVTGLREAGTQHEIPRCLIARAQLRRVQGRFPDTQQDLDEAARIASRGPMPLYQSDILLERARLHHAQDNLTQARDFLTQARTLIEKLGYHRRDPEVTALEEQLN